MRALLAAEKKRASWEGEWEGTVRGVEAASKKFIKEGAAQGKSKGELRVAAEVQRVQQLLLFGKTYLQQRVAVVESLAEQAHYIHVYGAPVSRLSGEAYR